MYVATLPKARYGNSPLDAPDRVSDYNIRETGLKIILCGIGFWRLELWLLLATA